MSRVRSPDDALLATLRVIVPALHARLREPWWIIGSAAMRVHGAVPIAANDVDVLCSHDDAMALSQAWSAHCALGFTPRDDQRFRSTFARFTHCALPVEIMGGLQVNSDAGWQPLHLQSVQTLPWHGLEIPVPTLPELMRVFRLFGREKDVAKAAQIRIHLSGNTSHGH